MPGVMSLPWKSFILGLPPITIWGASRNTVTLDGEKEKRIGRYRKYIKCLNINIHVVWK
jgi:hypothetical protein